MANAERFLDAFNQIEAELSRRRPDDGHVPFRRLVDESKELVPVQKELLRSCATLRNALVHTPTNGTAQTIADPRDDLVTWIEKQAEIIIKPPRVLDVLKRPVPNVLGSTDSVAVFLREVALPSDFSQSPVRMPDGALELITTNAFARWVAKDYKARDGVIAEDAPIADVLAYKEKGDEIRIRPRTLRAVDAWRIFAGENGVAPAAIALTQNGKASEKPLALIVKGDVPELLLALGL